ncbi:MAG: ribose 5-phosphate isomerase B [Oscillospiraceae bacterium]|jgi:ribose 5-phosphate isomerase B|nr:ribose 5-phosphate isomerase B [Oscillospiraceae bacterium]
MKISMACDHGGFDLKEDLKRWLTEQGHQVEDFGCPGHDSCDYADFAGPAAQAVAEGRCDRGIVICTTGIGVSITANKARGVRCALCSEPWSAEMTRRHNDANMLALGAGITGPLMARQIVTAFLTHEFEGGRHQRRIDKMMAAENR